MPIAPVGLVAVSPTTFGEMGSYDEALVETRVIKASRNILCVSYIRFFLIANS